METSITELRFLKVSEVAEILNVSRAHVYNMIADGQMPFVRIGEAMRIRPEDLEDFVADNFNQTLSRLGLK